MQLTGDRRSSSKRPVTANPRAIRPRGKEGDTNREETNSEAGDWLVGVVAVATVVVGRRRVGSSRRRRARSSAGGTLNVGWEQSFGFTDNFDPTGEYLGDCVRHLLDNLLVRTLVGYNHVAGAAGQQARPGHRDVGADADERRQDVHVPPQAGHQVQPAGQPRGHLARTSSPRSSGSRTRRTAASTRFYYTVIKGCDAYAAGKAKSISGISTPNTSTIVFNLTAARPATSSTGWRCRPTGPHAGRGHEVLRGPARQVRPRPRSRPAGYMIKGDRQGRHLVAARRSSPRAAIDGQTHLDLVRNPNYKQSDRPDAEELRRRGQVHGRREQRRHLQQDRGRLSSTLATSSIPPQVAAEVRDRRRA